MNIANIMENAIAFHLLNVTGVVKLIEKLQFDIRWIREEDNWLREEAGSFRLCGNLTGTW